MSTAIQAKELSIKRAVFYSALLPGSGQLYAGNNIKAVGYMSADLLIFFSYFQCNLNEEYAIDKYETFAITHAGIPENMDDEFYKTIEHNYSVDEYNANLRKIARDYVIMYPDEHSQIEAEEFLEENLKPVDLWKWDSKKSYLRYNELRTDKQEWALYANFAISAALINRLVSMVDAVVTVKFQNKKNRYLGNLSAIPDYKNQGMKLNYEFKF